MFKQRSQDCGIETSSIKRDYPVGRLKLDIQNILIPIILVF